MLSGHHDPPHTRALTSRVPSRAARAQLKIPPAAVFPGAGATVAPLTLVRRESQWVTAHGRRTTVQHRDTAHPYTTGRNPPACCLRIQPLLILPRVCETSKTTGQTDTALGGGKEASVLPNPRLPFECDRRSLTSMRKGGRMSLGFQGFVNTREYKLQHYW